MKTGNFFKIGFLMLPVFAGFGFFSGSVRACGEEDSKVTQALSKVLPTDPGYVPLTPPPVQSVPADTNSVSPPTQNTPVVSPVDNPGA